MNNPIITVVGSINMDLLTTVSRIPQQGETLFGDSFLMKPGGKGANQAVAAKRLGADVSIIGKLGDDVLGRELLLHLKKERINVENVGMEHLKKTGIANVLLYNKDNRIMIVPGVNDCVTVNYVKQKKDVLLNSDMVIMQMEIPIKTIIWCTEFCYQHGIPLIINPAPANDLPDYVWNQSAFITPNEEEANQLFCGGAEKYADKLITTLGAKGAGYKSKIVPPYVSNVVDTTGAGDTFNGALAYYLAAGFTVEDAILRANIAASLAIEKLGAQDGMPTHEKVEERLKGKI